MTKAKPQVLIVDDHPTVLSGLQNVLEDMSYDTTALANADSALTDLRSHSYHLILLDMNLPDIDGKTLLNIIRISDSDTPILVISGSSNTSDVLWMLKNGAQGFINKSEPTAELKKAIRTVTSGERYEPYQIPHRKCKSLNKNSLGITSLQKQIIELIEEGYSNKEISKKLGIVEGTIAAHI